MTFCHCCLKETEQDFCRSCSKLLFGVTNFSAKLCYNAPQLAFSEKGTVKRISISGAQIKFSAKIEEKTLASTDIGGTHILKPVLQSIYENNQDSPANEHVTMLMARNIFKIPTALSALLYFDNEEPVYITKRFDVIESGNRAGQRLNQSDFAQIAGLIPERDGEDYKYKESYERIAELISENVSASKIAVEKFFKQIVFDYLVCNGDAHMKNFSLQNSVDNPEVYDLTPTYDLLNTSLHMQGLENSRMALDLFKNEGDFATPFFEANGFYGTVDFMEFAKRIGVVEKRAARFIKLTIDSVPAMEEMLEKSFLSEKGKAEYKKSIRDRAKALSL